VEEAVRKKLQAQLKNLRSVLVTERGEGFRDLFDEFLEHHEFELALHTLCDFVLESDSPPVTTTILEQIQHLHASMKINDSCVEQLRKKTLLSR
jgi:hypothetical protein